MDEEAPAWVIAQTKPNAYRIAETHLARQGFETYLPTIEETRRQGGRFLSRSAPVFPGYVFIALRPGDMTWRAINATKGVTKLVSVGARPAEIPPALIAALRARYDPGGAASAPEIAEGDAVRISTGPFTELVGTIDKVEARDRIWVLLDVLGRTTRVAMRSGDVLKT